MSYIVEIQNLSKTYKGNDFPSVNNFSLKLKKGKIYGILGPNGAGKTTLINIITGLLKADSGKIVINNFELPKQQKQANKTIGFVPQEIALYQNLTAFENLDFFSSQYNIKSKIRRQIIKQYLEEISLSDRQNDLIKNFSIGMKRRINLLAGLIHNPELIILDEPTVGTDVQSKIKIINLLKKLNKQGKTIIYTSHLMDEAEQLCDEIIFIKQGKNIQNGSPAELIKNNTNCKNLEEVFVKLTT